MKRNLPEQYREQNGRFGTTEAVGFNGAFLLPRRVAKAIFQNKGRYYQCLISDGMGWAHVSVSIPSDRRCPTWEEMCYIKSVFFEDTDCVVQYHPSKDQYVNNHPYCLHLWQSLDVQFPTPLKQMVGI